MAASIPDAGASYRNLETVNGSIHLAAGVQARDVETVNGSIHADDNVQARGMQTVNGAIRGGRRLLLGGDIETVNGGIFIDHGSRIDGGVEIGQRLASGWSAPRSGKTSKPSTATSPSASVRT